jgi:tRNA(Ile)-lysidine synthase
VARPDPGRGDLTSGLAGRTTFPAGPSVVCAVSGGADSLALLVLARHAGLEVCAVHVDHGLRAGSDEDAAVVRAAAERFDATFESVTVRVEPGPNLEERAREARYAALPADVLTGHTADDQAETVLLHLLRGGGLAAAAGMPVERRPLIGLRRAETHALCAHLRLRPVVDPSNADRRFRRNRVRHEVLPLLADVAERDVVPLLARAAEVARADLSLLDGMAAALDPTDGRALVAAPLPLARRAVRRWLTDAHPPDLAAVDRVLDVAAGRARATDVGGGRRVERTAGVLRLVLPGTDGCAG